MLALLALLATALTPAPVAVLPSDTTATRWVVDKTHSELFFRVRHLVSRVRGTFTDWDATITAEPGQWAGGSVEVNVRTASIDTNNDRRDTHLRSADFFEVEKFPAMTFRSTSVEVNGDEITLTGDLTIRDVTKPVVLKGTYLGLTAGQGGRDRIGFEVKGTVNRLDYGLKWNRAAEGGGLVLGDEVTIEVTVAAVKQVAAPAATGAR
jgi:polyisoprenoid-binding protein YceI